MNALEAGSLVISGEAGRSVISREAGSSWVVGEVWESVEVVGESIAEPALGSVKRTTGESGAKYRRTSPLPRRAKIHLFGSRTRDSAECHVPVCLHSLCLLARPPVIFLPCALRHGSK